MNVIVVGGAIGGSAVSLLLARAGARVTLLEKVASPTAVGAGIALAANGLAVLGALGLEDALSVGPLVANGKVVDGRGRVLLEPMDGMPPVRLLRRSTLATILARAVEHESAISTRYGVEAIGADPAGTVRVRTGSGEESLSADLVVAADGVHSLVRGSADFGAHVTRSGIAYLRGLVRAGLARDEEAWTAAGLFGSVAVDDGTYFYASMGTPGLRAAIAARDLGALTAEWVRAYPASRQILDAVEHWDSLLFNDVIAVRCARWSVGRLVLLGDAAHAMAPNVGQGANSALVDASVLVHALCDAPDVPAALRRYEARRKTAVHRVADTAARLGRLAEIRGAFARTLRDRILIPVIARTPTGRLIETIIQEPMEVLRRQPERRLGAAATAL